MAWASCATAAHICGQALPCNRRKGLGWEDAHGREGRVRDAVPLGLRVEAQPCPPTLPVHLPPAQHAALLPEDEDLSAPTLSTPTSCSTIPAATVCTPQWDWRWVRGWWGLVTEYLWNHILWNHIPMSLENPGSGLPS